MFDGFYWGAGNPYLGTIWVKVRRQPRGLNPDLAMIGPDANGAHIIYECMTNRAWGMGASPSGFDQASFNASAQTLFNETFGMSLLWTRSDTIEAFVNNVLDHIHGTLFVNPSTGLITLKLLRDDYNINALRTINPSNAKLTMLQRKVWGETANEVSVVYTNPETEDDATVSAQDLANIAQQGGVIPTSRNYHGVRNAELAARLAERDLRISSQPLASLNVEMNRSGWNVIPGEVVLINWPEKGIQQLIGRVSEVKSGAPRDRKITFDVYEDVFGLISAEYLSPRPTDWVDPSEAPAPLIYAQVLTAPAYLTAPALGLTDIAALLEPNVISMVLAAPDSRDDIAFELIGRTTTSAGALVYTSFGTRQFVGGATLATAISAEAETFIATFAQTSGSSPLAGGIIVIGEGTDATTELCLIKEVTETGWTLSRGILDTVPRAWPVGTRVWSLPDPRLITDVTLRSEGEATTYRLLTQTSRGLLAFEDAPPEDIVLTGRPHMPFRPAGVTVAGAAFGTTSVAGKTLIEVAWKNRNRLVENNQIVPWNGDSVAPEFGQTTTIRLRKLNGDQITEFTGVAGTAYGVPVAAFGGETSAIVQVLSERGDHESLQAHSIILTDIGS